MWIRKTTVPTNASYHAIAAAIFGEAGFKIEAERERAWLDENAPGMLKNMRQEIELRFGRPEDIEFFARFAEKSRRRHQGLTFRAWWRKSVGSGIG